MTLLINFVTAIYIFWGKKHEFYFKKQLFWMRKRKNIDKRVIFFSGDYKNKLSLITIRLPKCQYISTHYLPMYNNVFLNLWYINKKSFGSQNVNNKFPLWWTVS